MPPQKPQFIHRLNPRIPGVSFQGVVNLGVVQVRKLEVGLHGGFERVKLVDGQKAGGDETRLVAETGLKQALEEGEDAVEIIVRAERAEEKAEEVVKLVERDFFERADKLVERLVVSVFEVLLDLDELEEQGQSLDPDLEVR